MELKWTRSTEYVQQRAVETGMPVREDASMEATPEVIRALPEQIRQTLFRGGRQYTSDVGHVAADHAGAALPYAAERSWCHGWADIRGDYEPEDMTPELWACLWDEARKRAAKKAAEWYDKERPRSLGLLAAMRSGDECPYRIDRHQISLSSGRGIKQYALTEEEWTEATQLARSMMEEAKRAREEREARRERDKQEREAQELEAQKAWIQAHGSERLRMCMEEGIEYAAIYRDERLRHEAPDWVWDRWDSDQLAYSEPRNPSLAALQMLREARGTFEDAELQYATVSVDTEDDDYCDTEDETWRGFVCTADPEWGGGRTAVLLPANCPLS